MKKESSMATKPLYVVVGTRAQLIKTAPVMKELQDRGISYCYVYTGQHKETMDDLRAGFGLKEPDVDLSLKDFEADNLVRFFTWWLRMISFLFRPAKIFSKGKGIVITHGDTVTCWWAALLGRLGGCKVAHLESGLRSFNIFHPFPEEINRLITFSLTNYYFCPNDWALNNLRNFKGLKINTGGNTLMDSVRMATKSNQQLPVSVPAKYIVWSIHRFENVYNSSRFSFIIETIKKMSEIYPCYFMLHPVTRNKIQKLGIEFGPSVVLLPRLDFISFIKLVSSSQFLVTDGGSNQEESSYLGHPCLLMRDRTERIEGLDKNVVLSRYDEKVIFDFAKNYSKYRKPIHLTDSYPSKVIVDHLEKL